LKHFLKLLILPTILSACSPATPLPITKIVPATDAPTVTITLALTSTSTLVPTATATITIEPTTTVTATPTEEPVILPDDLAAQVSKLNEVQQKSLLTKSEDTRWKLAVYDRIKAGSPNLKFTLSIWENPGVPDDVEVAYRLPSTPNKIYFPDDKLQKNHSLLPAEITEEMMKNQGVVTWYFQLITKELEKSSGVPAGSKLARVNGDWVYLSSEGVEAKLNVKTGAFEQQVVRNAEGQIPLEDGVTIKLLEIKEYAGGLYDFTEKSGLNPYPNKVWNSIRDLPGGYESTIYVFEAFNTRGNDMSKYGNTKKMSVISENSSDDLAITSLYSENGDPYARLYIAVRHNVGRDVKKVFVGKMDINTAHVVFDADDAATKDLIPQ
jgi:hypothetical protein